MLDRPTTRNAIDKIGHLFWTGLAKPDLTPGGVAYISLFTIKGQELFTLDAYKDYENGPADTRYFYEAGKMVLDFFMKEVRDKIYTMHDIRNRPATAMCKRLGFIEQNTVMVNEEKFVLLLKQGVSDGYS
jgi:hypothetical protein